MEPMVRLGQAGIIPFVANLPSGVLPKVVGASASNEDPEAQPWFSQKPRRDLPVATYSTELNQGYPLGPVAGEGNEGSTVHHRVASSRVPDNENNVKLQQLAEMLDREHNGSRKWDVSGIFDDLFSDSALGINLEDLAMKIQFHFEKKGIIRGGIFTQKFNYDVSSVATFLNHTADTLAEFFLEENARNPTVPRLQCRRRWNSDWHDRVLPGCDTARKPDLVLLDNSNRSDEIDWKFVYSFGEVTSQRSFHQRLKNMVDAKSYIMFLSQHDRNFVPALVFYRHSFLISIVDRESQQYSRVLQLYDGRWNDIFSFFRVIIGLMFAPPWVVGIDTTMVRNKQNHIEKIWVNNKVYNVVKLLYSVQSMLGRGTKVWEVEREGKQFVLKDNWITRDRSSEAVVLEALENLEGVPKLIDRCDVTHPEMTKKINYITPVPLCTSLFRRSALGRGYGEYSRVRRRVVGSPHAEPLGSFRSRVEVCVAFRDYIQTLGDILKRGWVHRDISFNNIMLYTPENPNDMPDNCRRGIIIDFDYAGRINTMPSVTPPGSFGGRMGTAPYMAIEILAGSEKNVVHTPLHDLESLLYVLLHMCTTIEGPGAPPTYIVHGANSVPLLEWFDENKTFGSLARAKRGQLSDFNNTILKHFLPYWEPLQDVAKQFLTALFPSGMDTGAPKSTATHNEISAIFSNAIPMMQHLKEDYVYVPPALKETKNDKAWVCPSQRPPKRPRSASSDLVVEKRVCRSSTNTRAESGSASVHSTALTSFSPTASSSYT